jgi:two-component system response regulator YesN
VEEYQPDIIVLDINMPILNGLDVLEVLKMKKISSRILMVSAYSKFQYAQKAVNMGVDGYILKPVNEKVFVEAVQKLCLSLETQRKESSERGSLENLKSEYKRTMENEIISDVLLGEVNVTSMNQYVQLYHPSFCGGGTCLIRKEDNGLLPDEADMRKMLEELNLFCTCFWKKYRDFYAVCLLPDSDEQKETYENWIQELFGHVKQRMPFFPWNTLVFGISSWKNQFEEFPTAMRESRIAVQGIRQAGFYCYCEPQKKSQEQNCHKEFYECRCLVCVDTEKEKERRLRYALYQIWKKTGDKELLRVAAFALLCAQRRSINDSMLFEGACHRLGDWTVLSSLETPEEILDFVICNIQETNPARAEKEERSYVEKCLHNLECRYMEKISLETAANELGISSFYLSRLFKQEVGRTFTEVLTDIRICAALDQMWKSRESFQQIAEQVGYEDVSYFYKVLKKKMNMTANELRSQLRKIL